MRILLAASAAMLALAACDGGKPEDATSGGLPMAEADDPPEPHTVTPTDQSCSDIAALAAAMSEPEPFASLRTGNASLGGQELSDTFTTDVAPAGASCTATRMSGYSRDSGLIYAVNCRIFSSGATDREKNAEKAKAAFQAARNDLDKCLPGWKARDGSNVDTDSTEVMIYESPEDAKRAMDASYYVYPVELKKVWSAGGGGESAGWRVTVDFQKDTPRT
jgi:hypothetical protein